MGNEKKYKIVIIVTFVVLMALGLYIGFQVSTDDKNIIQKEDIAKKNDDDKKDIGVYDEDTASVSTKTYDIEVVYEDYYSVCGHKETKKDIVYGTTMDKLKQEELQKQKKQESEYVISEETKEKIVFKRTINQYCANHFKVKFENEKINIYKIVNEGVETLEKTLETPIELIRPELLEELKIGIKVDSRSELNLLTEDIES